MKFKILILILTTLSTDSFAFDLEDYAGGMRETRNAMIKAQGEAALSYDALVNHLNLLRTNCLIGSFQIKNWSGLSSGSCIADGKTKKTETLGNQVSQMIRLTPFISPDTVEASNNLSSLTSTLGTATDIITITAPSASCTPALSIISSMDPEDLASTYREKRDAFLKAANQLKLAIPVYKAAFEAYKAATAVYVKNIKCESGMGRKNLALYDPYIPDPDHVF